MKPQNFRYNGIIIIGIISNYCSIPLRFRELIKLYVGFISDKCPENCEDQRC